MTRLVSLTCACENERSLYKASVKRLATLSQIPTSISLPTSNSYYFTHNHVRSYICHSSRCDRNDPTSCCRHCHPPHDTPTTPASQCNTGDLQCCNSSKSHQTRSWTDQSPRLLGVVVGALTGQVGVTCSPISAIGLGGNSCSAQPVCCSNNSFSGIVALAAPRSISTFEQRTQRPAD
ncbi:fungal hydrophobin-domain-containing protein [Infundibulicybe gibba]|nr:fungal hydrophobin-domain-containing protein [Infundibulicybe gibba]